MFLLDIRTSIELISRYVNGMDLQALESDMKTQDAVVHRLELIGEAVGRLTPDLTVTIPTVPWSKIKAMRNLLIHHYWAIDMQTVWSVIHNDLPGLKNAIEDHLG